MQILRHVTVFATLLTLCVVMLGAYVRLSDAGLGCPDWPGCYGHLDVPVASAEIEAANAAFPQRKVDVGKAWKEMAHRYLAGGLGIVVAAIAVLAWRKRHNRAIPWRLASVLLLLVIFQAALGMWTVTLQLQPAIVTAHLLGGLTTLGLLAWISLRLRGSSGGGRHHSRGLRLWARVAIAVVACQVALGGWTSSNYAALACTDFPTCQSQWWPTADFAEGFVLWRGTGVDYEFGVLDNPARVAVHMAHRLGAVVVLLYIGALAWHLVRAPREGGLRRTGMVVAALLGIQIGLGICNVVLSLPLWVAVAHNGVAALLILALVVLNHKLHPVKESLAV